jgi:hypothetical protein
MAQGLARHCKALTAEVGEGRVYHLEGPAFGGVIVVVVVVRRAPPMPSRPSPSHANAMPCFRWCQMRWCGAGEGEGEGEGEVRVMQMQMQMRVSNVCVHTSARQAWAALWRTRGALVVITGSRVGVSIPLFPIIK